MSPKGYVREFNELLESVSYGRLYRIQKICGTKFLCLRYHREGKKLKPGNKRVTVVRHKNTSRDPRIGDFVYVSNDGIWSHLAVDTKDKGDENDDS